MVFCVSKYVNVCPSLYLSVATLDMYLLENRVLFHGNCKCACNWREHNEISGFYLKTTESAISTVHA